MLGISHKNKLAKLTPREREVLNYMAQGHISKVIAHRLGVAEVTVKAHTSSIHRKLGVTNRMQAALYVYKDFIRKIANGEIDNPKLAANEFLNGGLNG